MLAIEASAAVAPHPSRSSSGLASLRNPFLNKPTCQDHSTPPRYVCRQQALLGRSFCLLAVLREVGWFQVRVPISLLAPLEVPVPFDSVPLRGGNKWLRNYMGLGLSFPPLYKLSEERKMAASKSFRVLASLPLPWMAVRAE